MAYLTSEVGGAVLVHTGVIIPNVRVERQSFLWLRADGRVESSTVVSSGARLMAFVALTDEDELTILSPD